MRAARGWLSIQGWSSSAKAVSRIWCEVSTPQSSYRSTEPLGQPLEVREAAAAWKRGPPPQSAAVSQDASVCRGHHGGLPRRPGAPRRGACPTSRISVDSSVQPSRSAFLVWLRAEPEGRRGIPAALSELANEPAQEILEPHAEHQDLLHVLGWTGAENAGYLHGRAAFAAFGQRDTVGAALVRDRLPCRALRGIEHRALGGLSRLLP